MRIFCLDLHIGPVRDFKTIVQSVRPDIEIVVWNLSGHMWVFGETTSSVDIISNATDWFDFDETLIQKFQDRYDSFLSEFDAFFVAHAFSTLMVYEKYNKPIYCWNTCRYDLPFNFVHKNPAMLDPYHQCIRRLHTAGLLRGFANNLADQEYIRLGTGVTLPLLPTLGDYTGIVHRPTVNKFLWYSDQPAPFMLPNLLALKQQGYSWSSLGSYRGIIHIPYEISTMSIAEHYTAGIPIFVPSKAFLKQLWVNGAPWQSMSAYWGKSAPRYFDGCHTMNFWIDRADFYNNEWMPYVYTFNSYSQLTTMLQTFRDETREKRLDWLKTRRVRVLNAWKECLHTMD